MAQISDKEILILFKHEDQKEKAFRLLVEKYQEKLYWLIRRMVVLHDDADDVLQNTFIKVWKNLASFKEASKLYTWLYRIATNESLNFIQDKKKKSFAKFQDYETLLSNSLEDDEYFDNDEIQKILQKAILELPEMQRLVFNMKYFEELKYEDMAKILEKSVGALKASYHHAVKKIETYVKEKNH